LVSRQTGAEGKRYLDLGCSGGQLVKDFLDLGWTAAGLEGSDYSQKFGRANWPVLGGKNLFTCDITKPFDLELDGRAASFHLITAWEVLEHIPTPELEPLFKTISNLLAPGGYFIASTSSAPDIHDGIDLHQTKMTNAEWKAWLRERFPRLEDTDLGLKYYQFVRFSYRDRSFITCRKG
jgi:2-polyprenyl-3-methyl-5-hydroxy-6-metoxy-1,4-benzoquinol methylase